MKKIKKNKIGKKNLVEIHLNKTKYLYEDNVFAEGGYFDVYKGFRESDGTVVAIKIIKEDRLNYADASLLGYEKQILLNSSNYFPVIFDIDNTKKIVAEEWLDGKTLNQCINEKAINHEDKYHFMKLIAYSVYLIHSLDVIHRDLHSNNIQLNLEEKSLKILDFNAAKSPQENRVTHKSPGVEIWGPNRDPALKKGSYLFDKKSDIYSIGIVFSEIILEESAWSWGFTADLSYDRFKQTVLDKLFSADCDPFVVDLIKDMISYEGMLRPNILEVLNSLEIHKYEKTKKIDYVKKTRESGFAFLTKVGSRIELFLRKRDVKKMSLLPRSQLDLKFLFDIGNVTDIKYMLLVPRRAVMAQKIIMFAELSIPNYSGSLFDLIDYLYNKYSIIYTQSIEGFQNKPETKIFLILGQDEQTISREIHYYLNPLKQELIKYLFKDIEQQYLKNNPKGMKIWKEWKANESFDSAVVVSAHLEKKFFGKIPYQQSVRGYLSSANHADPSHEIYSVIKGLNTSDRLPQLDKLLEGKKIILLKISTDAKQRDIALKICDPGIHLARVQVRSILPTDYQLTFIHSIVRTFNSPAWKKEENFWNIESLEIKDAIIRWNDDVRYSVRLSLYITCLEEKIDKPCEEIYRPMVKELYNVLRTLNGEANEAYITNIYSNNNADLRFLNN